MPGTAGLQQLCTCRGTEYVHRKDRKDHCKRKRQVLVYNPEEEIWHEPYMQTLRREFSDESVHCDSKIELPWSDISLPSVGMKIRSQMTPAAARRADEAEAKTVKGERRESTGAMELPWQDLTIAKVQRRTPEEPDACDSSLEIPWADLTLSKTAMIRPPREEPTCASDDVEIPWDEILVPRNIVIEPPRKRRHPSSDRPPRPVRVNAGCISCGMPVCCAKIRAKTRSNQAKTHPNAPAGSNWIRSCM